MSSVRFHYADIPAVTVKGKAAIKDWVEAIFRKEGKGLSRLDYIFCSDTYLLDMNKQFLQHDYYTDIITFDLSDNKTALTVGEIYISVDRVKENAAIHEVSFGDELLRVMAHGALHLCGYGDKTKREITLMRSKEDQYLRIFGT
jgi:probable rRNA maturation factor